VHLLPLLAAVMLADHPLAGRAWDVQAARFIDAAEVERRIAVADIAMLGETHDNPAHHELQLKLYRGLVAAGRKPTLALEQLDAENQAAVDAARAQEGATPATLAQAGKVSRGWNWAFYEPLVAVALEHRLPIVAANLSRSRAREAAGARPPAMEEVWNDDRQRTMRALLVASHCGDDSPMIDAMVDMQRARDALMAERIAQAPQPVVAIMGRGHADARLGVPLYLRSRFPQRTLVSVGLVEVREGAQTPSAYSDAASGAHDIVWFTPRAVREDPCAGFKR
jgi:uncharacterized iron-regulated protein